MMMSAVPSSSPSASEQLDDNKNAPSGRWRSGDVVVTTPPSRTLDTFPYTGEATVRTYFSTVS